MSELTDKRYRVDRTSTVSTYHDTLEGATRQFEMILEERPYDQTITAAIWHREQIDWNQVRGPVVIKG